VSARPDQVSNLWMLRRCAGLEASLTPSATANWTLNSLAEVARLHCSGRHSILRRIAREHQEDRRHELLTRNFAAWKVAQISARESPRTELNVDGEQHQSGRPV
jgi:hypothetical protein